MGSKLNCGLLIIIHDFKKLHFELPYGPDKVVLRAVLGQRAGGFPPLLYISRPQFGAIRQTYKVAFSAIRTSF